MANLISKINQFDYYYEMSDSPDSYSRGKRNQDEILRRLQEMSASQLQRVRESVEVSTDLLSRYFKPLAIVKSEDTSSKGGVFLHYKKESKSFRSRIFSTAWKFLRKGLFTSFGEALRAAWSRYKVIKNLKAGATKLLYRKANGLLRSAMGTLKAEVLAFYPKAPENSNPDVVRYWDLEKQAWRSFRIERLISMTA